MPLVKDPNRIRLAMLGMVDGNGHPYSWSAITNGRYDAQVMAECGYPVIPQYMAAEPKENLGIPGVEVTHIWCDDSADARKVAKAAYIANVVDRPEDVIGHVDAVIIPTDRGHEHVARARPFIEAGLPVFIDKPLVDNELDLRQFVAWQKAGKPLMSTSAMRYANEFIDLGARMSEVGEPRIITISMAKSWERYGIHALEAVYPLLPPGGWESVCNTGSGDSSIVHARHASGVDVVLMVVSDLYGAFGQMNAYGTKGQINAKFTHTFAAFKAQLVAFVEYLRTGQLPFEFEQTVELMKIIIAGIRSREQGGCRVMVRDIMATDF